MVVVVVLECLELRGNADTYAAEEVFFDVELDVCGAVLDDVEDL